MQISRELLISDLHRHLKALGSDDGQMSVSVYDTAQVLRLVPPQPHQLWAVLDWLREQQQVDGAWNATHMHARERTAPTLAATMTMHLYASRHAAQLSVVRGLHWLQRNLPAWNVPLPDDLPVGVELILPHLVSAAVQTGMAVPTAYAESLEPLRRRRLAQLAGLSPAVLRTTTAIHSWEAWGTDPHSVQPTTHSGIGASPAATAAWLASASACGLSADQLAPARAYLERATAAIGHEPSGLYPTAWPIDHFEIAYSLHSLAQHGLHQRLELEPVISDHLDTLSALLGKGGVGATFDFPRDGDDTAAALGALQAFGRPSPLDALIPFLNQDHAVSYVGELQPSLITTARAAQVITAQGGNSQTMLDWLVKRQEPHGLWPTDKWNADRRYVAAQVILALTSVPEYLSTLLRARDGLLAFQHNDGGWGEIEGASQYESTAYAVMGLRALPPPLCEANVQQALDRAQRWMAWHYRPFAASSERHWLAKDRYRPHRLARLIELSALLGLVCDHEAESA